MRALSLPGMALTCVLLSILILQVVLSSNDAHPTVAGWWVARATTLLETGVYGDLQEAHGQLEASPSRSLPPAYPFLVAGIVYGSGEKVETRCAVSQAIEKCLPSFPYRGLIAGQIVIALLGLWIAWHLTYEFSRSHSVSTLTVLLMLIVGRDAELVQTISPLALMGTLLLLLCYMLVLGYRKRQLIFYALAGIVAGALVLSDLINSVLAIVVLVLIAVSEGSGDPRRSARRASACGVFALGAAVTVLPWFARNLLVFGDVLPGDQWTAIAMAGRVAYNDIGAVDAVFALVYWLPVWGDAIASLIFSPEHSARLHAVGSLGTEIYQSSAHLGFEDQLSFLVSEYVLGDLAGYLKAMPLLILRGYWSGRSVIVIWALVLLPFFVRRLRVSERKQLFLFGIFPLAVVPIIFTLYSANSPGFSLPVTYLYAYIVAAVSGGLELPRSLWRFAYEGRRTHSVSTAEGSRLRARCS
jgi:hypothetical protein